MSVFSSVVLSAEGQGSAIGSVDDLTGFMHVELPSIDPLKLLTLYTIIAKLEFGIGGIVIDVGHSFC